MIPDYNNHYYIIMVPNYICGRLHFKYFLFRLFPFNVLLTHGSKFPKDKYSMRNPSKE